MFSDLDYAEGYLATGSRLPPRTTSLPTDDMNPTTPHPPFPHTLSTILHSISSLNSVIDMHRDYAEKGMQHIEAVARAKVEGEEEGGRDLEEIQRAVRDGMREGGTTKGSTNGSAQEHTQGHTQRHTQEHKKSITTGKSRTTDNNSTTPASSDSSSFTQSAKLELNRYYHSVDIATARCSAVLSKLNAPLRAANSTVAAQIAEWQKELHLDDHADYSSVRFNEKSVALARGECSRELLRLQENLNTDQKTEQVKSVHYWGAKKVDRAENEETMLAGIDRENLKIGYMLQMSEEKIDCLQRIPGEIYKQVASKFQADIIARKAEWVDSLKIKYHNVESQRRIALELKEKEIAVIADECAGLEAKIKELNDKIILSGVQQNMESDSYLALTKKHEQKQKHLMAIIDRQQARINQQLAKVAELEDEEEELDNYLDELNASVHLSKGNPAIVEHTVNEILKAFKVSQAKRRASAQEADSSGNRKLTMALRKTTMMRKATTAQLGQMNKDLSNEHRRLEEALAHAMSTLGISNEKQQKLHVAATELKKALDEIADLNMESETLETEIDDMDSLLYRFNAVNTLTKGGAELSDLSFGADHDFVSVSRDDERKHKLLHQKVADLKAQTQTVWDEINEWRSHVNFWAANNEIRNLSIPMLSSLRLQMSKTPERILHLKDKEDPVTDFFRHHRIPDLNMITKLRSVSILSMMKSARLIGCKILTDLDSKLEESIRDGSVLDSETSDEIYSAVSAAFMICGAPETFKMGNITKAKLQLENGSLSFGATEIMYKMRCCLEVLKIARAKGLSKDDAALCGNELVKAAIMGRQAPDKVLRIMHAAMLVAIQSMASMAGIKVAAAVEKDVKSLLHSTFESGGASIDTIARMNVVLALVTMTEISGKRAHTPPGFARAMLLLTKCVSTGDTLQGSDLILVQSIVNDAYKEGGGEGGESHLPSIQGVYSTLELFMVMWIDGAIKSAEKMSKQLMMENREEGETSASSDDETDSEEEVFGEEKKEEKKEEADLGAWKNSAKWKRKGYEILLLTTHKQDMFNNLAESVRTIKATKKPLQKLKGDASSVRPELGFSGGTFTKGSPKKQNGRSPSFVERNLPSASLGRALGRTIAAAAVASDEQKQEVEEDEEISLILDSTSEVQLTADLKRWCEDALETDSLRAHKLAELWNFVNVFVTRQEETSVTNELEKIEKESILVKNLLTELHRIFGKEDSYTKLPGEEEKRWRDEILDLPEIKDNGEINRNNYSLLLLELNKESQSLTRKLAPTSNGRRSTIGFVNSMMFTKRVANSWKKNALGGGGGESTLKTIEGLAKRKQEVEFEIVILEQQSKDRILTRQQTEMRNVEEENDNITAQLVQDLGEEALVAIVDDKKSSFEKLKEENAMIRQLRKEIRALKDEQIDLEDKLKLVRKGKGDAEELLMSPEDKEEKEENLKKLRRTVRMFQRAIKKCRDKWQAMKREGKLPETAGAKKLRESMVQAKVLKAFGGSKGQGLLAALAKGKAGKRLGLGADEQAAMVSKVKVLQFGFGASFDPVGNSAGGSPTVSKRKVTGLSSGGKSRSLSAAAGLGIGLGVGMDIGVGKKAEKKLLAVANYVKKKQSLVGGRSGGVAEKYGVGSQRKICTGVGSIAKQGLMKQGGKVDLKLGAVAAFAGSSSAKW